MGYTPTPWNPIPFTSSSINTNATGNSASSGQFSAAGEAPENGIQMNENAWKLIGWMLRQFGGSVSISSEDELAIFANDLPQIDIYRVEHGALVMKIKDET